MTLNSDVTVETYASNGYVQMVYVNAKRTTSESLTDASYYAVTTTMVIDSSLSVSSIDSLMANLVSGASNALEEDFSITKNGIKYTANIDNSSILFCFAKE